MNFNDFHSAWITIADSRVFLETRLGFPTDHMRFIAQIITHSLNNRRAKTQAKLVHIFYDDKSGIYQLFFASDSSEDENSNLAQTLVNIINDIENNGNYVGEMVILPKGNKSSERYDHMAHLSKQYFIQRGSLKS